MYICFGTHTHNEHLFFLFLFCKVSLQVPSSCFFQRTVFKKKNLLKSNCFDCSSKKRLLTIHLAIIYAVNDAEEKPSTLMYFRSLLKSRYYAVLLFLIILVVRNNYRLLFYINKYIHISEK